jgi:hypothetical protein
LQIISRNVPDSEVAVKARHCRAGWDDTPTPLFYLQFSTRDLQNICIVCDPLAKSILAVRFKNEEQPMTQHTQQVFSGITLNHYAKLTEKARANGIAMNGNSGSASKYGVELEWNYEPEAQQLTVKCLRTPVFVSVATVYSQLREMVEQSKAEA